MLKCRERKIMTQYPLETCRGFTLLKDERNDVFSSGDEEEDPEQREYLVRIWYF